MNTIKCGECKHYWARTKPLTKGGEAKLTNGYCLKRTVFAKNRPNNPIFPKGAILEDRENGMHLTYIVNENGIKMECTDAVRKEQ